MTHRHALTDAQWARLAPLLPQPKRGPQPQYQRRNLNGIRWILATGAQWRDLPERYGPWQTVASQFYRWCASGVWEQILATLQQQGDAAKQLDWSAHFVDGTVVRAHQHAAGARRKKGGLHSKRSDTAVAASAPKFTYARSAAASPSPSC
jgi:transposase